MPAGVSEEIPPGSANSSSRSSGNTPDLRRFNDVKKLLRNGSYEEAHKLLEALHQETPGDQWVLLYLSLCEQRLRSQHPFGELSEEQLQSLHSQLNQESHAQARAHAIQKAVNHQIEREQAAWDSRLEKEHRQAEREARAQETQSQKEAKARTREASVQAKVASVPPPVVSGEAVSSEAISSEAAPISTEAASGSVEPQAPATPAPEVQPFGEKTAANEIPVTITTPSGSVELQPVQVPATRTEAPSTVSPSLVGQTLPVKGAVQIHARQMSVSPDQRIAIADGDVEVVFENAILTCDHLTLFTDTKDVYAEGNVRVEEGLQVFRGEAAQYNFENKKGRFLQGTISSPPWHEHGRTVEHIAEGVYEVTPGYLTTCELEPPHFKLSGQRAIIFADERLARISNVALFVEKMPFLYLPFISFADRQMPFFIIPGKKKPWGPFVLMGYRYKLPIPGNHKGTVKLDWRRGFGWGEGLDHQFDSPKLGQGLFKFYYNQDADRNKKEDELVKGADKHRYRVLWRHRWNPMPDTTVVTDIQKYSDIDFRKDLLFREEFTSDDVPESFVSIITNDQNYTLSGLVKKRINRFQSVTNTLPQLTVDARPQQIGKLPLFSESHLDFASFDSKTAHSEEDTDAVRVDWFQQVKYALNWFRPVELTPKAGIRQTYYNKDRQGSDREGDRNVFSGQWNTGAEASLKLFRLFGVNSNLFGMNLHGLRHVLTPTIAYDLIHRPTVANELLNFSAASSATNRISFGVENKLQTRRPDANGKLRSVDLGRFLIGVPYTFRGAGNKQGGRLGDWSFDFEAYPTSWMRLETDWTYQAIKPEVVDSHSSQLNLDLVMVGGREKAEAKYAPGIQAPAYKALEPGPQALTALQPQGEWYLGLGHRYSRNDKTEDVLQYDWQITEKWQIGTFHRFTWKEVSGGSKRFNNLREYQYRLRRDLHDWVGEVVYRVDREFGEEIFFTLTLKAYPEMPIALQESYNQPKIGSQSSPFSPIRTQQ